MLREYITRKLGENEDLVIDLESEIRELKNKKKELETLIKFMEDESEDGSDIFSPRNHRIQNLDKLNGYRSNLDRIIQEEEEKKEKLIETKRKKAEYQSMLAEIEKNSQKEEKKEKNEDEITDARQPAEHFDTKRISDPVRTDSRENISEAYVQQEKTNDVFADDSDGLTGDHDKLKNIEIKSGELIVLESERRKEKEFLNEVKKKIETCLAFSGSSRNKYRNELEQIKEMIEGYIASIEM